MRTVLITDVRYRTAMAVIRPLKRAGYRILAVQASAEAPLDPPAFVCRSVDECVRLDGSVHDAAYADRLLALCRAQTERPALFPIGADTLSAVAARRAEFQAVCYFLVADPEILDSANDKRVVARAALACGVPVPREFDVANGERPVFPVILKPRCGEKLGLHAEQRYAVARNAAEFDAAWARMSALDPQCLVQELVEGPGCGVCLVMDAESRPVSVFCHRRIREYPITGGPSACCESLYDEKMVVQAVSLLQALHFVGIAMVEFKGGRVLEINPRVWGSYPLTEAAGSRFAEDYIRAASGTVFAQPDAAYRRGQRMRFVLNDTLSVLAHLKKGHLRVAASGLADLFRAKEALFRFRDQRPFWRYLHQTLRKGTRA